MKITQVSINGWMDKETMVCVCVCLYIYIAGHIYCYSAIENQVLLFVTTWMDHEHFTK